MQVGLAATRCHETQKWFVYGCPHTSNCAGSTDERNSSKRSPVGERSQRMPMGVVWVPTTTMHPSSHEPNQTTRLRSRRHSPHRIDGAMYLRVGRLPSLGLLGSMSFTHPTTAARSTSFSFMGLVERASGRGQSIGTRSYSGHSLSCPWSKTSAWRGY